MKYKYIGFQINKKFLLIHKIYLQATNGFNKYLVFRWPISQTQHCIQVTHSLQIKQLRFYICNHKYSLCGINVNTYVVFLRL